MSRKKNSTPDVKINAQDVLKKFKLKFNHSQIEKIFTTPYCNLTSNEVDEILKLPRLSAIEDFERIIKCTFRGTCNPITDHVNRNAVDMSLILLYYFQSIESLPVLLDYLRQDMDYFYIWQTSCAIDNFTWPIFTHCAMKEPNQFLSLSLEPDIVVWNRASIFTVFSKAAILHPEQYDTIIGYFKELLMKFYLKHKNNSVYDDELVSLIEKDIMDIGAIELISDLQIFHEEKIIDESYWGNFSQVVKKIKHGHLSPCKSKIKPAADTLRQFSRCSYTIEDEDDALLYDLFGMEMEDDDISEDELLQDMLKDIEECGLDSDNVYSNYDLISKELNKNNGCKNNNDDDKLLQCHDICVDIPDEDDELEVNDGDGTSKYFSSKKKTKFLSKKKIKSDIEEYEEWQEAYMKNEYYVDFDIKDYL